MLRPVDAGALVEGFDVSQFEVQRVDQAGGGELLLVGGPVGDRTRRLRPVAADQVLPAVMRLSVNPYGFVRRLCLAIAFGCHSDGQLGQVGPAGAAF